MLRLFDLESKVVAPKGQTVKVYVAAHDAMWRMRNSLWRQVSNTWRTRSTRPAAAALIDVGIYPPAILIWLV